MCGANAVGIVKEGSRSTLSSGTIFAHEVGHMLNMGHDTGSYVMIKLQCSYMQLYSVLY